MKRFLRNDTGEGTTLAGKLYLTPRQRSAILKWLLYSLSFLLILVLQDVIFSQVQLFGGTPCVTPMFILLVGLLEGPNRGGIFALCAGSFYAMSGVSMGSASLLLLTATVVLLGAVRMAYLRPGFWPLMACCVLGLFIHDGGVFLLGAFLKLTTLNRWGSFFVGWLLACLSAPAFYPLVKVIGRIGAETWKEE